jgi:hypothetical protein
VVVVDEVEEAPVAGSGRHGCCAAAAGAGRERSTMGIETEGGASGTEA